MILCFLFSRTSGAERDVSAADNATISSTSEKRWRPLTKLEKSTFMSTANGFSDQAVYNADYLNLNQPVGYRGLNIERVNPAGLFSIPLGGDGVGRKAQLGLGALPASATTAAYELNIYFPNLAGDNLNTTIPAGSSAKFAANQINETMSDLGIRASARNRIELYSLSGNGEVSFDIESRNQKPIRITTSNVTFTSCYCLQNSSHKLAHHQTNNHQI